MRRFLLALTLAACASSKPPTQVPQQPESPDKPEQPPADESIGSATMLEDGTIQLHLIARGDGGLIGQALLSYPPGHEKYDYVLKHLGGLAVGESKLVPPFPPRE